MFWNLGVGSATIGSFLLAVRNYRARGDGRGPTTGLEIKGTNHDIELNLYLSDESSKPLEASGEDGGDGDQQSDAAGQQSSERADGEEADGC